MKIKHLLLGMLAMAATVACNQEEPVVTPELDLNKTTASVGAEGGSVALEVTSNVDWTASADQDWVSVDPATGKGSKDAAKVTVSVEPNESEEARTATVTVAAEKLTKTLKITQAGVTSQEPEPEPEVAWSMMGCFVDNQWASDVPMTKEGEWIVAKGAQFTELTFKIRGNASWDDATNIGYAPGTEKGLVNAKLSVVTAEYSKANLGGDAADIKLNGVAGTYDVYFSFEKLEVYVMEEGYKPGEREPVPAEPKEVTYTVTGTIADHAWENNYEGGLMVAEGDYLVAKNIPLVWNSTLYGGDFNVIELKILETGTWDGYAYPEKDVMQQANTEVALSVGGENVAFAAPEGTYDVYFDKANAKLWVMNAGYKPGETPEPEVPLDPAVKEIIWEDTPFDLGSDWSKGLQINSVPRLPEDARIHVVYEAPAGYDYYQFKFCYVNQEWNWVPLTSPTGMNADGCVTLDASATEYSFALNAEDIAAINSGRGLVVQGYAAIIKEVYYTSEIEVGDGPKVVWEGRYELLSDWTTALQIQNMPHLESGMSLYVTYEASGYDYYQFKFCYIDQNWNWNAMTSPVDVNEYGCVMLDASKTEYVLALNDDDIAAINAGKGMVIQGYGAVITKVSYK